MPSGTWTSGSLVKQASFPHQLLRGDPVEPVEPKETTKPSAWGGTINIDSKESIEQFMAAAHVPPADKTKVRPVPGVPPHLWHLHQDKLEISGTSELPSKGKISANDKDKSGLQADDPTSNDQPREGKSTLPQRYHQINWSKTRRDPKPNLPWTAHLFTGRSQERVLQSSNNSPEKTSPDKALADSQQDLNPPGKWIKYADIEKTFEHAVGGLTLAVKVNLETRQIFIPDEELTRLSAKQNDQNNAGSPTNLKAGKSLEYLDIMRTVEDADGGLTLAVKNYQNVSSSPTNLKATINPKPFVPKEQVTQTPLYQSFVAENSCKVPASTSHEAVISANNPSAQPLFGTGHPGLDLGFSSHLEAYRQQPRNRNSSASSKDSLRSVSTIRSYGGTAPGTKNSEAKTRSDIRNTIAPKHNINNYGNTWIKVNWGGAKGEGEDHSVFTTPSFVSKFVFAWMEDIPTDVRVDLHVTGHHHSDIDTDTGRFLMPIECPETMVDPEDLLDRELGRLRQNNTAMLRIEEWNRRMTQRRQKGAQGNSGQRGSIKNRRSQAILTHNVQPNPVADQTRMGKSPYARLGLVNEMGSPATTKAATGVKVKFGFNNRNPNSPAVPCYLRPAGKKDMNAVTKIYNLEVMEGMQALDSAPLSVEDFKNIFSNTEKLGMPFIVAVRGSARDLVSEKGNFELSPYTQLATYAADPMDTKQNGAVLGFAYLSVWEPGLAGNGNGSSRATARIILFVDPKYRRKKIGFSLLDKLISTVSRRFSPESAYDFVDLSNSPVYKHPLGHERKYFRLYLSYFVKHVHNVDHDPRLEREQKTYGDDLVWVKRILEERFNFTEKVRFESTHRTNKLVEGRAVFWLDSVVFEHTCHLDPRFTTDY